MRSLIEVGETSGIVTGSQVEGGVPEVEAEKEDESQDSEEVEDLSNYQLARDRAQREIVKPARFTEDSELAFALSVAEVIESEEPTTYDEAMRSRD